MAQDSLFNKSSIEISRLSPYYEIKQQAILALGNNAGDGFKAKDLLLNNGILSYILQICQIDYDEQQHTISIGLVVYIASIK